MATIEAIRRRNPGVDVEVLIPDCKGDPAALDLIFDARPDVLNHNIETVPRLQRAVRPSASYARSLAVLARARAAGLATKSGIMVGLGESADEVAATLADLHGVGVTSVTIGQYLRPSAAHLPVARWWTPDELAELKARGEAAGITHIEASPLTRSSYHAARQAARATSVPAGLTRPLPETSASTPAPGSGTLGDDDRRPAADPDSIGAEITGLDLADELDDATFAELDKAFMDHKVLFCARPGHHLGPARGRLPALRRSRGAPVRPLQGRGTPR